jgi:hypothetical protein
MFFIYLNFLVPLWKKINFLKATLYGKTSVAKILLKNGANVTSVNNQRQTALHYGKSLYKNFLN